jgi:polyketide synthase PksN
MEIHVLNKRKILEMVQQKALTPEEGFSLLQKLQSESVSPDNGAGAGVVSSSRTANPPSGSTGPEPGVRDIAVIGMSGRFPGAGNPEEFWENLAQGVHCVREVPKERWDYQKLHDGADPPAPLGEYCKWGGFVTDSDRFDPLFFNITPVEAELIDPQQRLFLEEAWKALEDAGYSNKALSNLKCGVFLGAALGDYREILRGAGLENNDYAFTGLNTFILAARISYFLNLTGPNLSLDTACSSSLVAIHQACQSLISRECEMALAGGVRLIFTPDFHIQVGKLSILSPQGRCRVFDDQADGTVLSEGVGVIVLKRLADALRDRDPVYGVIKGSGVNHNGKSNGITALSPLAQTRLESEVYQQAGIDPVRIGYVESSGIGTVLGDAMELKALKEAFRPYTAAKQFCAVGSAKSNLGNTTMAAGVAGVIKILLALRHQQIPPTLHYETPNRNIDFADSPFFVTTRLTAWKRPAGGLRQAAVSGFGLSGTNCHMVIEEAPPVSRDCSAAALPGYLIPLSARTEAALRSKIKDLGLWLTQAGSEQWIGDIAYTLQVGRSHFPVRTALIVTGRDELQRKLDELNRSGFGDSDRVGNCGDVFAGRDSQWIDFGRKTIGELAEARGDAALYRQKLQNLAELYIQGYDWEWRELYRDLDCRCISMPAYPFARERYWISPAAPGGGTPQGEAAKLHPLIDANTSTLKEQKYVTRLRGDEFFLTDHRIGGRKILPGVVYLEMARAAGELAGAGKIRSLRNIIWAKPIAVEETAREVEIHLFPAGETVDFEVTGREADGSGAVHSRGRLVFESAEPETFSYEAADLAAIRQRCPERIAGPHYYRLLENVGLYFGPSLQSVQTIHRRDGEALATLKLAQRCRGTFGHYLLHPGLMDGAVETMVGLVGAAGRESDTLFLPFALGELEIVAPLTPQCYAHVELVERRSTPGGEISKFTLRLLDETGRVLVMMKDFAVRGVSKNGSTPPVAQDRQLRDLIAKLAAGEVSAREVAQFLGVANE